MLEQLVQPARACGFVVDVFVAMHGNARDRLDESYMTRLYAIDANASIRVYRDVRDTQFDTAAAFLRDLLPFANSYALVIFTRDDFVYRPGSWNALSNRYRYNMLNLVSTDCSSSPWDGLHVFPGFAISIFARAFSGQIGHHIVEQSEYTVDQVHFWFHGMYGQPDECEPAMGYLDRDDLSIEERVGMDSLRDQAEDTGCCETPGREMAEMEVIRSCPILDAALPPLPPRPPPPPPMSNDDDDE